MDNLLINIGADTKEFLTALSEVGEKAKTVDEQMKGIGLASSVAFAGFTAGIMETVYAYGKQEEVSNRINAVLLSTGGVAGVTADAVNELAEAFAKTTNFSNLQIKQAELLLLNFKRIGEDVFPEATHAVLELATKMGGDATSAANLLGRALENPIESFNKLKRAGVDLTAAQKAQITTMQESGNLAGAQKVILDELASSIGNQAEAANKGVSGLVGLKKAMEELAENIGKQLAPMVVTLGHGLQTMIEWMSKNQEVVRFTADVLAVGAAITGLVAGISLGVIAVTKMASALGLAATAAEAMGLATRVAIGSTGIGLLVVAAVEIYQHWSTIWPAMQKIFQVFTSNIGSAAEGLGKIMKGAFTRNLDVIKEGWEQTKNAFKQGYRDLAEIKGKENAPALPTPEDKATAEQIKRNKDAQDKRLEAQRQHDIAMGRVRAAASKADELEETGHTAKLVALAKERARLMATVADENFKGDLGAVKRHLKDIEKEYKEEQKHEAQQLVGYNQLIAKQTEKFSKAEKAKLVASLKTASDARHQNVLDDLNFQIAADNLFLQEADRYGVAYAKINQVMHSKIIKGTQDAFKEMSQMQSSHNEALKAIGKAAAVSTIAMDTVTSAMNIFKGWSNIPYIGYALGIAGAAAATAYGLEREGEVLGMAEGGQVPLNMGIPGLDSVPIMAKPGEVFAPPETFKQMVEGGKLGSGGQQTVNVIVSFKDRTAARMIQVQTVQDKALGTYRG